MPAGVRERYDVSSLRVAVLTRPRRSFHRATRTPRRVSQRQMPATTTLASVIGTAFLLLGIAWFLGSSLL